MSPRNRSKLFLLTLALIIMIPVFSAAGEEKTVDGVLHIINGPEPREGRKTLVFEEQWRLGGDDEDEIFGMISQVLIDKDNIYMLDTQLSEVKVYDKGGEFVRTLGREGEGPGEVRQPADMLFMPDGSLGLVQIFPGKITKIDMDGNPAGVFKVGGEGVPQGGFLIFYDVESFKNTMVLSATMVTQGQGSQARTTYVASHDMDGNEKVRYEASENTLDFQDFKVVESESYALDFRKWALGEDGRVYTASYRNRYALNVYNPEGALDRVIEREFEAVRRSAEEKQEFIDSTRARIPVPFPFDVIAEDTEPTINAINFGPDGNLWVSNSRSTLDLPDGIIRTYDIFDPDGHYLHQYALRCEGDGEEDIIIMPFRDQAVQVTGFTSALAALQGGGAEIEEDEEPIPMEVVYHKVVW